MRFARFFQKKVRKRTYKLLTIFFVSFIIIKLNMSRDGRVVDCGGLENR